jgi:hypothetical protein
VPHFEAGTQIKKKKQKEGEEREGGRKKGRKECLPSKPAVLAPNP